MARKAKQEPDEKPEEKSLHKKALARYKELEEYWGDNRKAALADIKFRTGDQWPEHLKSQREKKRRPALTFHKQEAYIRQVVNDGRQNRPSIKYRPVDGKADIKVAEGYQGLVRSILASSNADEAFDTALDNAAGNGFGYFRVLTDYADDGGFEQDIKIARIRNPLSVLLAPHQCADGSDAEDGFVIDEMGREEFKRTYPNAKKVNWQTDSKDYDQDWLNGLTVRVAEYFYKEATEHEIYQLADGQVVKAEEHARLIENGATDVPAIVSRRKVRGTKVKWCRLSGAEVLEESEFPSKFIPIIPVYGTEMDVNGKVIYSGIIRPAKDALMLYNYERTAYCERVALTPKAPYIVAAGQTEGHDEWETANSENHPYLTYNQVDVNGERAPPPRRESASDIPAGFAQGIQITEHDIQSAIGIFASGLGDRSNEKSGVAIQSRQREGDVSTFHYHDNLARATKHLGRILLDMIPRVIDTKRMVRMLGEDGSDTLAWSNPEAPVPYMKMEGFPMFNFGTGRYDVDVSVGPSYTTMRQESADAMMEIASRNPAVWQTHGDLIAEAQDWPHAEEFAKRSKALLPPEIRAAIDEDSEDGPPPEVKAIMEQAQAAIQEREAALQGAAAKIEELERAAAEKQAEIEVKNRETDVKAYEAETERLQVLATAITPEQVQQIVLQTLQQLNTPGEIDSAPMIEQSMGEPLPVIEPEMAPEPTPEFVEP